MIIETNSAEETYQLGKQMGEKAGAGEIYCLDGDLGTGKTVFTQGFAAGLGVEGPVNSPPSPFCSSTTAAGCPCTILTSTASETWRRWMRSAMRSVSTEKG